MTAPPLAVECDLDLRQTSHNGLTWRTPRPVAATLRWTADDPWAVTLDFTARTTWIVGWELLEQSARLGGRRTVGDGDIRFRRPSPRHLEVRLSSPDGTATYLADPLDLIVFVEAVAPRQRPAAARAAVTYAAGLRVLLDGAR